MRQRFIALVVVALVLAVAVTALALGGDDVPAATDDTGYVGLRLEDAVAKAEADGAPWRIAREDDEDFALTADLRPGRVTFEVDGGIVTVADIEEEFSPSADHGREDAEERAGLLASALLRLVTVENGFGGQDVFEDLRVLATLDGEPLTPIDRDVIEAVLSEVGAVTWIDDFDAEVAALFDDMPTGIAVLRIDRLGMLDDRSEVELSLWCGPLCGVFLTYEAVPGDAGWEITGTVGPIAMA